MKDKKQILIEEGAVVTKAPSSNENKTGSWRTQRPVINQEKCIRCGLCWNFCPEGCILLKQEKKNPKYKHKFEINYDFCKGCGLCAKECPAKAITMKKEEK